MKINAVTSSQLPPKATLADFEAVSFASSEQIRRLTQAISDKRNILICGGVGSGKTILLGALVFAASCADKVTPIAVISQVQEFSNFAPNISHFSTDNRGDQIDAVTVATRDQVRIAFDDLSGIEAESLVEAWSSSMGGFATIRADSPTVALARLAVFANKPQREVLQADDIVMHIKERRIVSLDSVSALLSTMGADGLPLNTSKERNMTERVAVSEAIGLVQRYGAGRAKAVIDGLETPRLAALLVQKYAVGVADLVESLNGIIGRDEVTEASDIVVASIDPDWRENGRKRLAAKPADIALRLGR